MKTVEVYTLNRKRSSKDKGAVDLFVKEGVRLKDDVGALAFLIHSYRQQDKLAIRQHKGAA